VSAWFREMRANSGVDENANGGPAMIVPLQGSNQVQLEWGGGLVVAPENGHLLNVDEVNSDGSPRKPSDAGLAYQRYIFRGSRGSGIDRGSYELRGGQESHMRFFNIQSGKTPTGSAGILVTAKNKTSTEARIRVVVLKPRVVRLAIRQVKSKDKDGTLAYHSKRKFEPEAWVKQMNEIWTPQANVSFDLVSKADAVITEEFESKIAKLLDLKTDKAPLPEIVSIEKLAPLFHDLAEQQVNFTIFLVKEVSHNKVGVNGSTDEEKGFALISDKRSDETTMAHEAGHFLGYDPQNKQVYPHFDIDGWLMASGRAKVGTKLPFDHVIQHFNPPELPKSQQRRK
jgi:hypothetical protein